VGLPLYFYCYLMAMDLYAYRGIPCLPPLTNGNGRINQRFCGTFPRPKNTLVREPFLKKEFDVQKKILLD